MLENFREQERRTSFFRKLKTETVHDRRIGTRLMYDRRETELEELTFYPLYALGGN